MSTNFEKTVGSGVPTVSGPWRILVVDDEKEVRGMVRAILEKRSHKVFVAANGSEAWTTFQRERPDLVITDIMMPVMNGIELLQRIREASPETEVVLITGFAKTDLVIQALRSGASNFVEKPFRVIELLSHLGDSFQRLALRAENRLLRDRLESLSGEPVPDAS